MRVSIIAALLLATCALGQGAAATGIAAPGATAFQDLVAGEIPAVVSISVSRGTAASPQIAAADPARIAPGSAPASAPGNAPGNAAGSQRGGRVIGSGFIIDAGGIIVTNEHVIEGAKDILVMLHDETLLRATVITSTKRSDVALLKVTPEAPLPTVRFGDSDRVRVGDNAFAIGNPLGLDGSVTRGIVSAINRDIRETPFDDFIQTDAAINHGNSGGPLFNEKGEVIGMNTVIFAPNASAGSIGLGFAIPSNDVRYLVDALRRPGGLRAGTLDFMIQQVTPEIADALDMHKAEGVIVGGTKEGGSASRCGILAGDIVLRYGDMAVTDVRELARAVARTPPGSVVNLLIWRNDEPMVVAATIGEEAPEAPAADAGVAATAGPGWRLASAGADAAGGVLVMDVAPDGSAAEAGIVPGDRVMQVQRQKVATPEDVARSITEAREAQRHYIILLLRNREELAWRALSLG